MVSHQQLDVSRVTKTLFVLCVALIMQSVTAQYVHVWGVIPDVLMTTALLIGLTAGPVTGAWLGLVCGLLADAIFRTTPFALSGLVFGILGYSAGSLRNSMLRSVPGLNVVFVVFGSMIGVLMFAVLGVVFGAAGLLNARLPLTMVMVGLLDGLCAILLGPLVRWAWGPTETATLRVVRS